MYRKLTRLVVALTVGVITLGAMAQLIAASERHVFTIEFKWKPLAKVVIEVADEADDQYVVSAALGQFSVDNLPHLLSALAEFKNLSIEQVRMTREGSQRATITIESAPVSHKHLGSLLHHLSKHCTVQSVEFHARGASHQEALNQTLEIISAMVGLDSARVIEIHGIHYQEK